MEVLTDGWGMIDQAQLFGFSAGLYILIGIVMIWVRWQFGFLRLTFQDVASQFGAPEAARNIAICLAVFLWPIFAKGLVTDLIDMRQAIKEVLRTYAGKCKCGGSLALDLTRVRDAIITKVCKASCASCGFSGEVKMAIRYKNKGN